MRPSVTRNTVLGAASWGDSARRIYRESRRRDFGWIVSAAGILSSLAVPACGSVVIDERAAPGVSDGGGGVDGGNAVDVATASGGSFSGTGGAQDCFTGQTIELASDQLGIVGMAANGTSLFWMNGFTNELITVPKSGGPVSVVISAETIASFAVDDSNVYWEGSNDKGLNGIIVTPISGGTSMQLVSSVNGAEIALDQDRVYWTVKGESKIWSVSKSGGEPTVLVKGASAPRGLALDQDRMYWMQDDTTSTQIRMMPKLGGEAGVLAASSLDASMLIVDETRLYWNDSVSYDSNVHHRVQSVLKAGGFTNTLAADVLEPVYRVAVDAFCVYWTTGANSVGEDRLLAISKGGGSPVELAAGGGYYELLVVDNSGIYLGDKHKGSVVHLVK